MPVSLKSRRATVSAESCSMTEETLSVSQSSSNMSSDVLQDKHEDNMQSERSCSHSTTEEVCERIKELSVSTITEVVSGSIKIENSSEAACVIPSEETVCIIPSEEAVCVTSSEETTSASVELPRGYSDSNTFRSQHASAVKNQHQAVISDTSESYLFAGNDKNNSDDADDTGEDSDEEQEEQSLVAAARKALLDDSTLDADFRQFCEQVSLSEEDIVLSYSRKRKKRVSSSASASSTVSSLSTAFRHKESTSSINSLTVALPSSRSNSGTSSRKGRTSSLGSISLGSKPMKQFKLKMSASASALDMLFVVREQQSREVLDSHGNISWQLSDLVNYIQPVKFEIKRFKANYLLSWL